jgi:hypothetical protein
MTPELFFTASTLLPSLLGHRWDVFYWGRV